MRLLKLVSKIATIGVAIFATASPPVQAAITRYTNKAAFEAALAPGAYTEVNMYDQYSSYSGGSGFSYTASASGGTNPVINGPVTDLSTLDSDPSELTFTFGSGIKAFGGYFYNTDVDLNFVAGPFSISFNDDAFVYTEESTSQAAFCGFVSDSDLINAIISVSDLIMLRLEQ